jgi:hypothetical protein
LNSSRAHVGLAALQTNGVCVDDCGHCSVTTVSKIPSNLPLINSAFDRLYTSRDVLSRAHKEGITSHQKVMHDPQGEMMETDNGASSSVDFAQDLSVEFAFFALGGWDTHVNQSAAEWLAGLAKGLCPQLTATRPSL